MMNNLSLICLLCVLLSACAELQPYSGADPFIPIESGAMPLHWAAAKGDSKIVKMLISEGSHVDLRTDVKKATPLHFAAWKGQYNTAKLLIEHGADVNAKDDKGATTMHYAAASDDIAIVQLLLAKGADINAEDKDDLTPLDVAMMLSRQWSRFAKM